MVRRVTPTKSPGVSLAAPSRQWASSPYSDLPLEGCPVAICRSSMRECRQGYATTLLSSVKRQVSAASRIILSYRHRGRGRARSGGRTPWGDRVRPQTAGRPSFAEAEVGNVFRAVARFIPRAVQTSYDRSLWRTNAVNRNKWLQCLSLRALIGILSHVASRRYVRRIEECERLAAACHAPSNREILQRAATQWRRMVEGSRLPAASRGVGAAGLKTPINLPCCA